MTDKPDWLNMNLSELVKTSLELGVVPMFKFIKKGEVLADTVTKTKLVEETPLSILEKQTQYYDRLIERLEKREGIDQNVPPEIIRKFINKNRSKKRLFQRAIMKLKKSKQINNHE